MNKTTNLSIFTKYVSLNVMSMIGLSFYILADTYFISNGIGENGLTALNLSIPIYSFVNGVGLMLGTGGATKFTIRKISGTKKQLDSIFMNMVCAAACFALVFLAAGIFYAEPLAMLLGADEVTLPMTCIYIRMTLLFSPAFMMNGIINCFVKNDGNPQLAMAAMFSGSIFNVIFDYIFIFPCGLGMFGAVLATACAPIVGLLVLSIHFIQKKNCFSFCRVLPHLSVLKETIPLGIPSLITELSSGVVIIIFNILTLRLAGNVGVAAYGIIANISLVILSVYSGIAQGMQPILSDAYGHGDDRAIRALLRYGVITVCVLSVLTYAGLFVGAEAVTSVFNRDANPILQQMSVYGIKWYFSGILFAGLNIVLAIYYASVEKPLPAQVISVLRGFLLIIPAVILLSRFWEMTGIWISFPVTELVTAVIGIGLMLKRNEKQSL